MSLMNDNALPLSVERLVPDIGSWPPVKPCLNGLLIASISLSAFNFSLWK